jgi:hypothetical protein
MLRIEHRLMLLPGGHPAMLRRRLLRSRNSRESHQHPHGNHPPR